MRRIINRISLILCVACLTIVPLLIAIEVVGYRLPHDGYFSFFVGWAAIFSVPYYLTRVRHDKGKGT